MRDADPRGYNPGETGSRYLVLPGMHRFLLLCALVACFRPVTASGCVSFIELDCGDGVQHTFEGCDDGNTVDGDGCDHDCKVEANWACVIVDRYQPVQCTYHPPPPPPTTPPPMTELANPCFDPSGGGWTSFNSGNPVMTDGTSDWGQIITDLVVGTTIVFEICLGPCVDGSVDRISAWQYPTYGGKDEWLHPENRVSNACVNYTAVVQTPQIQLILASGLVACATSVPGDCVHYYVE